MCSQVRKVDFSLNNRRMQKIAGNFGISLFKAKDRAFLSQSDAHGFDGKEIVVIYSGGLKYSVELLKLFASSAILSWPNWRLSDSSNASLKCGENFLPPAFLCSFCKF